MKELSESVHGEGISSGRRDIEMNNQDASDLEQQGTIPSNPPKHQPLSTNNSPSQNDLQSSTLTTSQQSDEIEFYQPQISLKQQRRKYGNMLIICQSKYFLLSLGPNYLFFFFAYMCFTFATIYLVSLANVSLQSTTFKALNFIFCWGQNLSYLLVALSNPGVVLPCNQDKIVHDNAHNTSSTKSNRYCQKCNAIQQRKTYHCRQCDVCIQQYDHHCPWTSKCIGGGNLYRFYFFVCMTPFYIFYYMIVFMICMANNAVSHNANIRVHSQQ